MPEKPHHLAGCWIIENGKVLILKQTSDGHWGPPAGHAEYTERPRQTAFRETLEETNLLVTIGRLVSKDPLNHQGSKFLLFLFLATRYSYQKIILDTSENTDFAWASLDEVTSGKYQFRGEPELAILRRSLLSAFALKTHR